MPSTDTPVIKKSKKEEATEIQEDENKSSKEESSCFSFSRALI